MLYSVRKATADDGPAVARIWHTGWCDGHIGHVPQELLPYRQPEHFVSRTEQRLAKTWVAERDGHVIGFVTIKDDEVEQLFVDRDARGTGVAAMLLRKGEEEIRRLGHAQAWLAVVEGNARARAFYARCGWRDAGPISYLAETAAGPFPVPTRRYEIDLDYRGT